MARQHKAAILPEFRGNIVVANRDAPTPQGKQALVKITAAGINPADWKIRDLGGFMTTFPAVLGVDGAGVIEAIGPEVTNYKPGDRIFFQSEYHPDSSTFQQYALVNTVFVSKIPANISDDQAATIPVGAFTAALALFQKSGIELPLNGPTASGQGVFILGGSSSVGQYAIQLARLAGFSTIAATSSSQHTEYLKSLGATHIFDRDVDAKTIQSVFSAPVALAFDSIATVPTQSLAFEVLTTPPAAPNARLSLVRAPDESIKSRNTEEKVAIHSVFASPSLFKEISVPLWGNLGRWIEQGKIVPNRVQVVTGGLAGVSGGLDLSRKGVSGVKLVVHPQE